MSSRSPAGSDFPTPVGAAYTADRAAALAGVPLSTLYHWAREGIWIPSVSSERVKRWSYADLLALRLIDWLRREKLEEEIQPTSMHRIRKLLNSVEALGERLRERSVRVIVDKTGRVVLDVHGEALVVPLGGGTSQTITGEQGLSLVAEWRHDEALRGPDLIEPRPSLRIIPGKLSGEPHAEGTRIPSRTVWSLNRRQGLEPAEILELYPRLTEQNVSDAISLEDELERNLGRAA